jgi:hypothetical protein
MDFVEVTFSQNNVHCHKDNEIKYTITLKFKIPQLCCQRNDHSENNMNILNFSL